MLQEVDGKPMVVRLRSEGKPPGGGNFGPSVEEGAKLYVACIPPHLDERSLEDMFAQYGRVESCRLILDRETGLAFSRHNSTFSFSFQASGSCITPESRNVYLNRRLALKLFCHCCPDLMFVGVTFCGQAC